MLTVKTEKIEAKENEFYSLFLDKAIAFAKSPKGANLNNASFRQIVSAAGVMAKQRQSRLAMKALQYQINKEAGGLVRKVSRPRKLLADVANGN